MPAPQGYIIPEFNHSPHIIPFATPSSPGVMSPAQAQALANLNPGGLVMTGVGPGGAAKLATKNNTPTVIASVTLTRPGWYLIMFTAAATQDDVLAGAVWSSQPADGSAFTVVVGVPASGSPVVFVPTFPPGAPTFAAGGTSAAWAISGQIVGSVFSFLVAGDATRTVNWQLASTILSST